MPWIARRTLRAILLGWAAASVVILATGIAPGKPADRALPAWYFSKLTRVLTGDLGRSLQSGVPVSEEIGRRLPPTMQLLGTAMLIALLIGVPNGLLAGDARYQNLDLIDGPVSALLLAVPVFVAGLLLMLLFGATHQLWMPVTTLAIGFSAIVFRITRAAVRDVMQSGFVRVARSKGLAPWRILLLHVPRNALPPMLMALVPQLGTLLGGTALIEYLFHQSGMFSYLIDAVGRHDYPVVAGVVLAGSLLCIVLRLTADLLCAALDPRLRVA